MSPAVYETISVKIAAGKYRFTVAASKVKFEGFLSVYKDNEEKEASNALVKGIDEQSELTLNELNPQQHFTQPPAHYTERHSKNWESAVRVRMRRPLQRLSQDITLQRKIKIFM